MFSICTDFIMFTTRGNTYTDFMELPLGSAHILISWNYHLGSAHMDFMETYTDFMELPLGSDMYWFYGKLPLGSGHIFI